MRCAVMNAGTPSAKAASVIRTLEPVVANMTDLGLLDKSYIYGFDEMKIQSNKSVCKASDHPLTPHLACCAVGLCSSQPVVARLLRTPGSARTVAEPTTGLL